MPLVVHRTVFKCNVILKGSSSSEEGGREDGKNTQVGPPGGEALGGMNQVAPPGGHVTDQIMHIYQGRGRPSSSLLSRC